MSEMGDREDSVTVPCVNAPTCNGTVDFVVSKERLVGDGQALYRARLLSQSCLCTLSDADMERLIESVQAKFGV